jgi:TonB family protein
MRRAFPEIWATCKGGCPVLLLLLIFIAAPMAQSAQNHDDARHLISEWLLHHTVYVRHAYRGSVLRFDDQGRLTNHVAPGFWSDTGAVYATKVELATSGLVHIEALREATVYNHGKSRWEPLRRNDFPVVIEIQFSPAAMSAAHVQEVLDAIFTRDVKDFAAGAPDYWHPCLSGTMHKNEEQDRDFCFDPGVPVAFGDDYSPVATAAARINDRTQQPRAMKTVKPKFTDAARELNVDGSSILWVVVDEQGLPAEIYVASPLGYGLDDLAVIAVANWKFAPARLNGKPVRAQMTIAIEFHVPRKLRPPKLKW